MTGARFNNQQVVCLLLAAAAVYAQPADTTGGTPAGLLQPPAVQVTVFLAPETAYAASALYADRVSEGAARAELEVLASGLGYEKVDELKRSEPGSERPGTFEFEDSPTGSMIGFRVSERAFNRDQGTFKLEPFLRAFGRHRRLDLEFIVGALGDRPFVYRGITKFDSAKVVIRHHGADLHHEFTVEVLDPGATTFNLPPFAPPEVPLGKESSQRRPSTPSGPVWLLAVLSVAAGAVAYWVTSRGLRRWRSGADRRRRQG